MAGRPAGPGPAVTGPGHYREAEYWLSLAEGDAMPAAIGKAQVHATLALAAATIDALSLTPADAYQWRKATDPEYAAECAREVTP